MNKVYVIAFFNETQRTREERFYQLGGVWQSAQAALEHIYDYADSKLYDVRPIGDRIGLDGVWEIHLIYDGWTQYKDKGK